MKHIIKILSAVTLMASFSGVATAQNFTGQQDRAAYAGAYFSMSFGGGEASYKRPVSYGFSAGLRQRSFQQSNNYFGTQFDRRDANVNMLEGRDWQARVFDLNFSDRGFERLSLSGMSFAQKDALGQVRYLGGLNRFNGDSDGEENGVNVGKILLWTGAVIGVAGITLLAVVDYSDE